MLVLTADLACTAYRVARDEEDHLAAEIYRAAHEVHLVWYGRAPGARRGFTSSPWKRTKDKKTGRVHLVEDHGMDAPKSIYEDD